MSPYLSKVPHPNNEKHQYQTTLSNAKKAKRVKEVEC